MIESDPKWAHFRTNNDAQRRSYVSVRWLFLWKSINCIVSHCALSASVSTDKGYTERTWTENELAARFSGGCCCCWPYQRHAHEFHRIFHTLLWAIDFSHAVQMCHFFFSPIHNDHDHIPCEIWLMAAAVFVAVCWLDSLSFRSHRHPPAQKRMGPIGLTARWSALSLSLSLCCTS